MFNVRPGGGMSGSVFRSRAGGALGDMPVIPSQCWDKPGVDSAGMTFKQASDNCLVMAQQAAANNTSTDADKEAMTNDLNATCANAIVGACNSGVYDPAPSKPVKPSTSNKTTVLPAVIPAKPAKVTPVAAPAESSMWTGTLLGLPMLAWGAIGGALALIGVVKVVRSRSE